MTWREQQVAIMTDKLSGAVSITRATAQMLLDFAAEHAGRNTTTFIPTLQQVAREILTAQSGMASLVTLFNQVFFAVSAESEPDATAFILRDTVQSFLREINEGREAVCRKAAALIPAEVSLLTHSASSTVFQAIVKAKESGREPRVFNMEGRPLLEGRDQAYRLAAKGVDVTLIIDAAAYATLQDSELVLLGVDSLTETGIATKIGSASVAVSAQSMSIPCYFLANSSKVWPMALGDQPIHEREPADVWRDAPEAVKVLNHFYDITPWSAVAGVITEQGLLTAEEIREQSRTRPVHPQLQALIAEVRSTI